MPTSPSTDPPAVVSRMVPLVCSKVPKAPGSITPEWVTVTSPTLLTAKIP